MEERVINKLRKNKRYLNKISKLVKKNTDMESEMIDADSLQILSLISRIDEELTDIIYLILDSKNS